MSKLVDRERLAKLAQALDARMKAKVAEEEARALAAEAAVDAKANKNAADIAAINNAETGLLKQAKDYADGKIEEVNADNAAVVERVDALEAKDSQHDASIKANADAIAKEAEDRAAAVQGVQDALDEEIARAKAAEKVNADAIVQLNEDVEAKIEEAIGGVNNDAAELEARVAAVEAKNTAQDTAIAEGDAKALADAKAYADEQITALVNGAPDAMNTLNELAKAISDHQDIYDSYVDTVSAELAKKVDKVEGSRLVAETEIAKWNAKAEVADVEQASQDAKDYADAAIEKVNADNAAAVNRIDALEKALNDEETGLNKEVADIQAELLEKQQAIEAAQGTADQAVADAAAAKTQADKGVADAAAAKAAADVADDKAEAAQADIDALESIVGNAEAGLVKDIADNAAAIVAEKARAEAAEKANADAIAKEAEDRDAAIESALEPYSTTDEVKQILTNVVGSLNLSMVDDQVVLKLGGVEGVTLSEVKLDLATDADIEEIIAGLDA